MKVRSDLVKLIPGPKREWPNITPSEVEAIISACRASLMQRQTDEVDAYQARKPEITANAAVLEQWDADGIVLASCHQRNLADFDRQWNNLPTEVSTLNDLYSQYGKLYAKLQETAGRAKTQAETDLVPLEIAKHDYDTAKVRIDEMHKAIMQRFETLGVHDTFNNRFEGWEDRVRQLYMEEACRARHISHNAPPIVPSMPLKPAPIKPNHAPMYKEKGFDWRDALMIISGVGFLGVAAGSAGGGITFDSDGWHFAIIFWLLLTAAAITNYALGKIVFPYLVSAMMLGGKDFYPYLTSREEKQKLQRKQYWMKLFSIISLIAIFLIFISIDYYGWSKAAIEQNAAYAGDGGIPLNPIVAGIVMMFLTSLLASVKLAGVAGEVERHRSDLDHEILENAARYNDRTRKYEADEKEFNRQQAALDDYHEKTRDARGNIDYRMRQPEIVHIQKQIETYREFLAGHDPSVAEELDHQIDVIVDNALCEVEQAHTDLGETESKIDAIHNKATALQALAAQQTSDLSAI